MLLALCIACGRDTRDDALAEEALPPSALLVFGSDGNPRIYVADQDSSGTRLCFDAPDLGFAAGTPVTVIHSAFPQFATPGRLGHRSKSPCFPPPRSSPDSMQYVVDAPGDTIGHRGVPIVVLGKLAEPKMRGDTVLLEIEPGKDPWRFRSCASTEGIHATAWSGLPLSAPRRWHAYYYLGYDVEPDCSPGDFEADSTTNTS